MEECIFCKLISREIEPKFIYESDQVVAFHDIHPQADIHVLVAPKEHIPTFLDLTENHHEVLKEMTKVVQNLTKETKSDKIGYRIKINGGRYQEIPHLHWHLLVDKA